MDGAPYLRKVDLKMYRSYPELSMALEKMFSSFTSGKCVVAALTTMRSIQITGVDMSSSSCLSGNHNVYERDSAHASLQSSAPHMAFTHNERLGRHRTWSALSLSLSLSLCGLLLNRPCFFLAQHQERWRSARVEAEESKAVISARS
ncbi:hypothetical protein GW17_00052062 [Ensete ventricosum]|nr:hypothetical protein GW17_00052062 [Ensete ventricosum]